MLVRESSDIVALCRYGRLGASSRVRFFQYLSEIEGVGLKVSIQPLFSDSYVRALQSESRLLGHTALAYLKRLGVLLRARRSQIIWIEKDALPWLPYFLESNIIGRSAKVVIDYDDAVFHQYDQHSSVLVRRLLGTKHVSLMRRADCVVVGNRYLAEYAHKAGARKVLTVPSVIDLRRYQASAISCVNKASVWPKESAPITVGWVGQRSTAEFLRELSPIFEKLSREANMRFIAIGIDANSLRLPMSSLKWSEQTESKEISNFDIGIMPLSDGAFERGKCGYKLIQYMACGLPVVASPVGINCEIVEHGMNGFLAFDVRSWECALKTLASDPNLRKRMGEAGRRKVEEKYNLQVVAPLLIREFEDLIRI